MFCGAFRINELARGGPRHAVRVRVTTKYGPPADLFKAGRRHSLYVEVRSVRPALGPPRPPLRACSENEGNGNVRKVGVAEVAPGRQRASGKKGGPAGAETAAWKVQFREEKIRPHSPPRPNQGAGSRPVWETISYDHQKVRTTFSILSGPPNCSSYSHVATGLESNVLCSAQYPSYVR